MPTYQYKCAQCAAGLEQFQSFHDAPLVECPTCSQPTLKRVFQPTGIVFKGSGWYINDSKKSTASTVTDSSDSDSKGDSSTNGSSNDEAKKTETTTTPKTETAATPKTETAAATAKSEA